MGELVYLGRSRLHRSHANLIQSLHTASCFQQLGWDVTMYLPPWPGDLDVGDTLAALDVDPAPPLKSSQWLHPRWGFWPFIWLYRKRLAEADILYTRVPAISLLLSRAGLRHSVEVHDVEALVTKGRLTEIIANQRKGLVELLVPISQGAASVLLDAGADPARVHVAPSGVKYAAYADLPPFDPARLACPRVVHLGRLTRDRGEDVFNALIERGICQITAISRDPARNPHIETHSPVPLREVPAWYARSDLTLLPYQPSISIVASISPIKLFEAMAAGRPIIASDLPTLREILRDGQNALLVDPADPDAWEGAIRRLQDQPELAERCHAAPKLTAAARGGRG